MTLTRKIGFLIVTTIIFSLRTIAQGEFYQVGFELYKGTSTDFSDIVYCNFETGGNSGIDNSDLPKLDQFAENLSVYRNLRDFGIETRPLVNCTDTIQLRLYKTPTTTTNFRIVVDMNAYPVAPGLTAVMQDRFLNTERLLKFGDTTHVNFQITSNTATTGQRFRVVFRRTQVTTAPFTQIPPICRGEAIDLPSTSSNGVNGTWTPAVNNTATTTYTFNPSEGQCATTTAMTVTVNQPVTPTFTQVSSICRGGTFTLPTTSNNSISGSWLPAINNTQTTTYTFTPTAGQCATTTTMTVTVNQPATPTFTQVSSICRGGTFTLPTTSNNSITGTWSPAINNTQTTTYTFTPTTGQCATTTTMTVTVNQPATPTFTQVSPICDGGTFTLPTISNNSITGTWSPAFNNTLTTTYTFTPTQGQCATTTTMTVEVNPFLRPVINCGINTPNSVEFVWSAIKGATGYEINYVINGGNTPVTVSIDSLRYVISNLNTGDEVTITILPIGGMGTCFRSDTKMCKAITCSSVDAGTISGVQEVCIGNTTVFVPAVSGGIWSTTDSSIATVNSNGVVRGIGAGTTTITYRILNSTPGCADGIATRTVTVNRPITPTFTQVSPICAGSTITLLTSSNNSISGSWSPAIDNTKTTTYTFTPMQGQCANTTTMTVTVNQPVIPVFSQIGPFNSGDTFTLPIISSNGIRGSWSPAINNSQTTTYTFTPDSGICASTAQLTVTINNLPTSVTDLNANQQLKIYPNPIERGSGTVLFELGNFRPGRYQVSVISLNGIRLKEISLQHGSGTSNYRLSMDQNWSPGMYLIVISGENFFKTQKILFIK